MAERWSDVWMGQWDGDSDALVSAGEAAVAAGEFDPFRLTYEMQWGTRIEETSNPQEARNELDALPANRVKVIAHDDDSAHAYVEIETGPSGVCVRGNGIHVERASAAFEAAVRALAPNEKEGLRVRRRPPATRGPRSEERTPVPWNWPQPPSKLDRARKWASDNKDLATVVLSALGLVAVIVIAVATN